MSFRRKNAQPISHSWPDATFNPSPYAGHEEGRLERLTQVVGISRGLALVNNGGPVHPDVAALLALVSGYGQMRFSVRQYIKWIAGALSSANDDIYEYLKEVAQDSCSGSPICLQQEPLSSMGDTPFYALRSKRWF